MALQRQTPVVFAAMVVWASSVQAGGREPVHVVEALYAPYFSNTSLPKPPLDQPIFTSRLRSLIDHVRGQPEGEQANGLGFDVFVYAQDYGLSDLLVMETGRTARTVTVEARFLNLDLPTTVVFDFVDEGGRWRVDDIAWPEGGERLSDLLADVP